MFRYLLTCLRLLGMYYEQAGWPAYTVVLMLAAAFSVAWCVSFPVGLGILLFGILAVPYEAHRRTEEATSSLASVRLPRNQAVTTLYFCGLGNSGTQMWRYMPSSGYPGALGLLLNPVCIEPYDAHDFRRFNVAQRGDVNHALEQVLAIMAARPHDRFILFGTSRGAAVALQVACTLHKEHIDRVAFTVCEGVFDSAPAIIQSRFSGLVARFLTWALPRVTAYDTEHTFTPLHAAKHFINTEHPVLLVTSLKDQVVSPEHTKRVYNALVQRAPKAQLLTLCESPHSSYATWKDVDRLAYVGKMQEWVDKYV